MDDRQCGKLRERQQQYVVLVHDTSQISTILQHSQALHRRRQAGPQQPLIMVLPHSNHFSLSVLLDSCRCRRVRASTNRYIAAACKQLSNSSLQLNLHAAQQNSLLPHTPALSCRARPGAATNLSSNSLRALS